MRLGLLVSFLGNLFSQTRSLTRYRFENKFPKNFVAKKRNNNVTNNSLFSVRFSLFNETDFSRFTSHFSLIKPSHFSPFQKPAFTMAEVLITLGIIGIIAAMTLPSLIGKYQFKVFEVGLKKQYSLLQNAINLAVNDEGIQSCYTYFPEGSISYSAKTQDCDLLLNFLVSLLKLKPYNDDIKAKYAKRDIVRAQDGKSINWNCDYDSAVSNANVYGANDGTIFMFYLKNVPAFVLIDVNGEQKPNKWGYDVFAMILSNHNDYKNPSPRILLTDEFCSIIEKGGRFPRTILRNQDIENTSTCDYYL